jgi:hypothetical protein
MQKEDKGRQHPVRDTVSNIWHELLGNASTQGETTAPESEATLPTLESDPWGKLLQARGVEIIDLQQLHLHMSDQDVEKALQIMQEQPLQDRKRDQNSGL